MDPARISEESLRLIKQNQPQDYNKLMEIMFGKSQAYNQAFGLVWYDLEPAAKMLYPVN